MDREVFGTSRWQSLLMTVIAASFGLMLPVAAAFGQRPVGLWLVVAVPVVMLPLSAWLLWYGLIRPPRVEFSRDGLAVAQGRRRFALAWSEVSRVGVVREGHDGAPDTMLVAWPVTAPRPGSYTLTTFAPAVWDKLFDGYGLIRRALLTAGDDRLAAAVERYAPGRWGEPRR